MCVVCSEVLLLQLPINWSADKEVNDTVAGGKVGFFLKITVNQLLLHIYGRQNSSLHYIDIKYTEYMGSNKDSHA